MADWAQLIERVRRLGIDAEWTGLFERFLDVSAEDPERAALVRGIFAGSLELAETAMVRALADDIAKLQAEQALATLFRS
jgi:hypothetical protein